MRSVQKNGYTRFTRSDESDREGKVRMNLIYLGGLRETTTDLCYRYISLKVCFLGFVDQIIWIRKDSISISWFWLDQQDSTSHFRCVRRFCLTAQKYLFSLRTLRFFSPEKYLSRTAEKCRSLCFELTLSRSVDCLYRIGRSIDNFWPRLWIIICKSLRSPCIFI